jgi:hypothetical protein
MADEPTARREADLTYTTYTLADENGPLEAADVVGRTARIVTKDHTYPDALVRGYGSEHLVIGWPVDGSTKYGYVPIADLVPGSQLLDIPAAPTMTVRIRDGITEAARWGSGRGGPVVVTVHLVATCPQCYGPRGEVRGLNSCDDGEYYHVNTWNNPCGHVDHYHDVLIEAGVHPPKHLRGAA